MSPILDYARSTAVQIAAGILILAVVASVITIIFGSSLNNYLAWGEYTPFHVFVLFAWPLGGTALILLGAKLWLDGYSIGLLVVSTGVAITGGWLWFFLVSFLPTECYTGGTSCRIQDPLS